jgi:flagellar biogenesis protein FliO
VSSEQQALPSVGPTDPARAAREAQPLGAADRSGPAQPPTTAFSIGGLLRTLFALAVVVALIFACRAVVKRATRGSNSLSVLLSAGGRAPSGVLEVLGRYPISKQTTLVLLKIDRRVLLLSQGEHGFQTLAEITDADEVASILMKTSGEQSERLSDRFASIFQQFERGGGVENTPMAPEVVDLTGPRNPLASLRMRLAGLQEKRA